MYYNKHYSYVWEIVANIQPHVEKVYMEYKHCREFNSTSFVYIILILVIEVATGIL